MRFDGDVKLCYVRRGNEGFKIIKCTVFKQNIYLLVIKNTIFSLLTVLNKEINARCLSSFVSNCQDTSYW